MSGRGTSGFWIGLTVATLIVPAFAALTIVRFWVVTDPARRPAMVTVHRAYGREVDGPDLGPDRR
jgi:hypothetical protein